jgi:hypothetical protein
MYVKISNPNYKSKSGRQSMTVERLGQLAAAMCLAAFTGMACAAANTLDLALPAGKYEDQESKSFMQKKTDTAAMVLSPEFEPRLLSGGKVHQYLGVGTAVLAGLAFATHIHPVGNVPREVNGTHGELGKAAAAMALATVASGLIVHWDDFSLEDGWLDPDNQHVLLGAMGAALMAYAVDKSMNVSEGQVSHSGLAELGALGMVVAIKLTW